MIAVHYFTTGGNGGTSFKEWYAVGEPMTSVRAELLAAGIIASIYSVCGVKSKMWPSDRRQLELPVGGR
jgi:hypothetical protein